MNQVQDTGDSIQYQQLTAQYLEEALDLLNLSFFRNENVCRSIGLQNDLEALLELRELTTAAANEGVTVIAIDKIKNKVVGAAFNKLQVRDNPAFENFANSWTQKRSKAIVQLMADFDNIYNFFERLKIDCVLELMFLTTLPEYRGKGIGKKLTEISIELGKNLANGVNVKKALDGTTLPLEPAPKIISAIFTTIATQKIGKHFGFEIVVEKEYSDFEYEGKHFPDVAEDGTPTVTLEYKCLC